jgi:adenosylmethionine-8-amino-7-oxononanoate aminotransferase
VDSPPIVISHAVGARLFLTEKEFLVDGVSSWWVNIHGHAHPSLTKALKEQAEKFSQVLFANFTHEPAIELAEKLLELTPSHSKVFYSGDGSSAVEVALKIAIQFWNNLKEPRTKILALKNGYHGDTLGAMSAGDRSIYSEPFISHLFPVTLIEPPYYDESGVLNEGTPLSQIEELFFSEEFAAFIFEPILQCASGFKLYCQRWLGEVIELARKYSTLTIADEVATGFGRTGKIFACDYLASTPDIVCLSKGITSGTLPFAATIVTEKIFQSFLSNQREKMLLHSHSYCGNALGSAVALASLELLLDRECQENIKRITDAHRRAITRFSTNQAIGSIRQIGTVLAMTLKSKLTFRESYYSNFRDKLIRQFIDLGVFLRPIGYELYLMPPYVITDYDLNRCYDVIEEVTKASNT